LTFSGFPFSCWGKCNVEWSDLIESSRGSVNRGISCKLLKIWADPLKMEKCGAVGISLGYWLCH
jgi:hypothetical protein